MKTKKNHNKKPKFQVLEYAKTGYSRLKKVSTKTLLLLMLLFTIGSHLNAQVQAYSYAFNYFERQWVTNNQDGAGYSFYSSVYPIMQEYPGPEHLITGLASTWMTPLATGNEPPDFYNTIEGGLGWWGDTRFGTETPKFIMGGVANNFSQWANGVGAGSSDMLANGQRDWSTPGGKYGVAQLSNHILWPPDGLNMAQGANGEFLGYGYHPLPLTDVMQTTNGVNFVTGNQCWTLFLNASNFKGPVAFFIPKFWTETALNDSILEGLFLDQRPSDKNQSFAIECAEAPALIGYDVSEVTYAHILPPSFPATTNNTTELIKEIKVYTKDAMWNAVEIWFNGGPVAPTQFQSSGIENVFFSLSPNVDGHIATNIGNPLDAEIDMTGFATKISTNNQSVAGFMFDTSIVTLENETFIMPKFYKLHSNGKWLPIDESQVPPATGLVVNSPAITPRPEITYLTPKEPDCHIQNPQSPWNSPGPSAGPFTVSLGDGSKLTYYWYKFIEQPSIVHSNLPTAMLQNLQNRVEQIHTHWLHTNQYLPNMSSGALVSLDAGLIVNPPVGMEIGYVPIVTRQELDQSQNVSDLVFQDNIKIFPNPSNGFLTIQVQEQQKNDYSISIYDVMDNLVFIDKMNGATKKLYLNFSNGIYFLQFRDEDALITKKIIISK